MKVQFMVLHRKDRSPGQRYRHEQYIAFLEANGFECQFSPLLKTASEDAIFYGRKILPKVVVGLKALFRRLSSVIHADKFDIIFIYRDAFFFGTFFEKWLKKKSVKIIYDFDDAIWLMDKNENQGIFNRLKNPAKTSSLCALADLVIVGNHYLKAYAQAFNSNVLLIPSTVDLSSYQLPESKPSNDKVCIGWTGSFSTVKHFESLIQVLTTLKEKYRDKIYYKLIGDESYANPHLEIQGIKWHAKTEVQDLAELDIGIMPLPDNEWTKGKCGMKGLQYMALEIPTVMSAVGANKEIIQDGENGLLASTDQEWLDKLSQLIENQSLRKKLGKAGRTTVEKKYSVEANKEKWLQAFTAF